MTDQAAEQKKPPERLGTRLLLAFRRLAYASKFIFKRVCVAIFAGVARFAQEWISGDNFGLLLGVALLTRGASHWGKYVGDLTCGSLVLGLTMMHLLCGRRR
jgi:hypothetical protein